MLKWWAKDRKRFSNIEHVEKKVELDDCLTPDDVIHHGNVYVAHEEAARQ